MEQQKSQKWQDMCWHSRGSQDCTWNAVTQDISGDSTHISVLKGLRMTRQYRKTVQKQTYIYKKKNLFSLSLLSLSILVYAHKLET